jgi:hypothetical protein
VPIIFSYREIEMDCVSYDFVSDVDFNYLSQLIEENSLYEDCFENSRFLSLVSKMKEKKAIHPMSPFIKNLFSIQKISIVVAKINNTIVGISVFEHYNKTIKEKINEYFIFNKKKYQYSVLGFFGFYVKPQFRNNGIARNMVKVFEKFLVPTMSFDDNIVYIIASRGNSTTILNKYLKALTVSRSDGNLAVWRDDAKNYVKYNSFLTRKENIQHLQGY